MGDVVKLESRRVTTDEPFGGCPRCGKYDNILNVGRNHWAICDTHKTTWRIGSNLFSSWHHETEADWLRNEYRLAEHSIVEPIRPEPTKVDRREMEECKAVMRRTGYVEEAVNQGPMSDAEFNAILNEVFPLDGNAYTAPRRRADTDTELS